MSTEHTEREEQSSVCELTRNGEGSHQEQPRNNSEAALLRDAMLQLLACQLANDSKHVCSRIIIWKIPERRSSETRLTVDLQTLRFELLQ